MNKNTMTCEEMERLFLLATTKETTPAEQAQLEAHMRECKSCSKQFKAQSLFVAAARDPLWHGAPSDSVLNNIRAEAQARAPMRVYSPQRYVILALAASLLLAAGICFWITTPENKPSLDGNTFTLDNHADRIRHASALVEVAGEMEATGTIEEEWKLDILATRLLQMEGFTLTEPSEEI